MFVCMYATLKDGQTPVCYMNVWNIFQRKGSGKLSTNMGPKSYIELKILPS